MDVRLVMDVRESRDVMVVRDVRDVRDIRNGWVLRESGSNSFYTALGLISFATTLQNQTWLYVPETWKPCWKQTFHPFVAPTLHHRTF